MKTNLTKLLGIKGTEPLTVKTIALDHPGLTAGKIAVTLSTQENKEITLFIDSVFLNNIIKTEEAKPQKRARRTKNPVEKASKEEYITEPKKRRPRRKKDQIVNEDQLSIPTGV